MNYKSFLKEHKKLSEKSIKNTYPDLYEYIMKNTSFLPAEYYSFADRKFCIINNIKSTPKCPICGKLIPPQRICCSRQCVNKYNALPANINKRIATAYKNNGSTCFKTKLSKLEYIKNKNPELYNQLMSINWLPENCSYIERNYCLKHKIFKQPVCEICGKPTKFIQGYGYCKTCSKKCSTIASANSLKNKSHEEKEKIKQLRKKAMTPEKIKVASEKRKKTCIKKYGGAAPACSISVQNKMKKTTFEKYGVDNIFKKTDFIKQKVFEKYGVDNIFKKTDFIKQKVFEKYGCYVSQTHLSKEILEILNSKENFIKYIEDKKILSVPELCKNLSISDFTALKYIKLYGLTQLINRNISSYEDEIAKWLESLNVTIIKNKHLLNKKEIDIFLPDYNIGIEFNGNYWHSQLFKTANYHQEKSLLAQKHNIFLYHIFEYEWNTNKDKIKQHIFNLLNLKPNHIYARKCIIKELDIKTCNLFLEENHLQGKDKSKIKLGLFYNNKLVMVMTFAKPRFNKKYEWELSRLCSLKGTNIIGGASKLFKFFIKHYNPNSIISYSNFAKNKGTVYKILGFSYLGLSSPNYIWCKNFNILTRYQTQKHILLKQGFLGKTESDIMIKRNFYKIYDCGNNVWLWLNNPNSISKD